MVSSMIKFDGPLIEFFIRGVLVPTYVYMDLISILILHPLLPSYLYGNSGLSQLDECFCLLENIFG